MARRTAGEVSRDRERIMYHLRNLPYGREWARVETWMRPNDVAALVNAGSVERQVRKEYDNQRGYAASLFGGAGVMVRHRAYLKAKGQ